MDTELLLMKEKVEKMLGEGGIVEGGKGEGEEEKVGELDRLLLEYGKGTGVGGAIGRPRGREEGEPWDLQRLRGVHRSILTLHCLGLRNKEIADKLDITPQTVSNTLNSKVAQPILAELYERLHSPVAEISDLLTDSMPAVVREMIQLVLKPGSDDNVKARVGLGLMDRGGFGPTKTIIHDEKFGKKDLEAVLQKAAEGGFFLPSEVEEATFRDVTNEGE